MDQEPSEIKIKKKRVEIRYWKEIERLSEKIFWYLVLPIGIILLIALGIIFR